MVTILLLLLVAGCSCYEKYYWREYFGTIPEDAFIAGEDVTGKNIYIAQAYIKDYGLVIAQISGSGNRNVITASGGPHGTNKYTKILCGDPGNFYWMQSTAAKLHEDIKGKHPVIGGHQNDFGVINVGRISVAGETKIGKINSFYKDAAAMYYIDNGAEKKINTFQILMTKERKDPFDL